MAINIYKPTSPARRKTSVLDSSDLSKVKPLKKLTKGKKSKAGRNNKGKITVRHQGGGNKKNLREIDYKRNSFDIPAKVVSVEYDPNRNSRIALICYVNGRKSYIIAPVGLHVGSKVISSKTNFKMQIGNRFPLALIPAGTMVYNVELEPSKGGKMARSAGCGITLMEIEGKHAQLKMPSGEIRLVPKECFASIGQVSNVDYKNIRWGKAGRMRHRGIRPTVRGKVMNPVDHPHGGGEGRNSIGLKKGPKNVYGKKALGVKTRKTHKVSAKLIIRRKKKRKNNH